MSINNKEKPLKRYVAPAVLREHLKHSNTSDANGCRIVDRFHSLHFVARNTKLGTTSASQGSLNRNLEPIHSSRKTAGQTGDSKST